MLNYLIATDPLPPIRPGILYEYILAGNGIYLRAARQGLEVMIPIASLSVRGLPQVEPYLRLEMPKIPASALAYILEEAQNQIAPVRSCRKCGCTDPHGCLEGCWWVEADLCSQCAGEDALGASFLNPAYPPGATPLSSDPAHLIEVMFYLDSMQGEWRLWRPPQVQSKVSIQYTPENSLVEIHSHHSMGAFFSTTDDADQQGFRIYAVLGRINTCPTIRMRIGVYGYFWEVPAGWVFDLPETIQDHNATKLEDVEPWEETWT